MAIVIYQPLVVSAYAGAGGFYLTLNWELTGDE